MIQRVHITEAKTIAERVGAEAVVVLAFKDGRFAAASYGETKAKCAIVGRWLDRLVEDLQSGELPAPSLKGGG